LFEGGSGEAKFMLTTETGLGRSAVYDPFTLENGHDGGLGVKHAFRDVTLVPLIMIPNKCH
jgi:hypothetical protein